MGSEIPQFEQTSKSLNEPVEQTSKPLNEPDEQTSKLPNEPDEQTSKPLSEPDGLVEPSRECRHARFSAPANVAIGAIPNHSHV
jgi:hypothetical protein